MLQDCYPARLQVIYILHQPGWLKALVTLLRPFLDRPSLQQKFVLLGADYARLHTHIPASALPERLAVGGTLSGDAFDWEAQVEQWISEEASRVKPSGAAGGGGDEGVVDLDDDFDPIVLIEEAGRRQEQR